MSETIPSIGLTSFELHVKTKTFFFDFCAEFIRSLDNIGQYTEIKSQLFTPLAI